MLFTIEAETAEELRTKLVEAAAVFGARAATATATPPAETAAPEAPKKRGPKPKAPAEAVAQPPAAPAEAQETAAPAAEDDTAKTYTIEDVREAGKLLSTKKGIVKAREVLAEFSGATRPGDLKAEDYKAFVKRANAEANRK